MQDSDGSPARTPNLSGSETPVGPGQSPKSASSASSDFVFGLPFRRNNASLSAMFASTSKRPGLSRNASSATSTPAAGTPLAKEITESPFATPQAVAEKITPDEYRTLIARAFSPCVAVLPSTDVEELLAQKGIAGGLLELVRPFGETIQGKVTVRDSAGSSKTWEDYGVRFCRLRDGLESARAPPQVDAEARSADVNGFLDRYFPHSSARIRTGGDIQYIEDAVDQHLLHSEMEAESEILAEDQDRGEGHDMFETSPFHLLYLRRVLSGLPLAPHETFTHPVACVIAVSSRHSDPIDEFRQLNARSVTGDQTLPPWVINDYLRYYVLIHDEEHDDIQRSIAFFEQMKRHFGLHCHLLRLRSAQCLPTDDGCERLPIPEFMSASEELSNIHVKEQLEELDDTTPCLFESDAAAVRNFVRELVTQSVVPLMERSIATWNDQIVSRRRGLSGRFLSLSKKWTPFGSRNSSSAASASGSNYDPSLGYYRADAPEALMRKLADYALMLRDYKNAQSVYDLLRTDYSNDKAWKYYAGANEMSAISLLLSAGPIPSRGRNDTVDQMLEAAAYSYTTRCAVPFYALRALMLAMELLGGTTGDDAARWGTRILELELVAPTGHALLAERLAACYGKQAGSGSQAWGSKRRKAAFWSVLACRTWLRLGRHDRASQCLERALVLYGLKGAGSTPLAFEHMREFLVATEQVMKKRTEQKAYEPGTSADLDKTQGAMDKTEGETAASVHEVRKPRKSFSSATSVEASLAASREPQGQALYFDPDDPLGSREV